MSSAVINTTLSNAITSADGFHHLVYSISGTTHTLFLDNSEIAINISGGNVFTNYQTISNLFFGIAGDLSYGYTGYLDDVKVFNRALVASDVSSIYNLSYVLVVKPTDFNDNFATFVSSTIGYTGGSGTSTRYFSTNASTPSFTFTTSFATWTYLNTPSNGYAVNIFYKGSAESGYFFGSQDNYLTDTNAKSVFLQCAPNNTSTSISTTLTLNSGIYKVSFAVMQTTRSGGYLSSYINIKVSLGDSYIIFNNTGSTYTTSGTVSLSAYNSANATPSTLMANNTAINNLKSSIAFVTLTFSNISSGINILSFNGTTPGDGFLISQVKLIQSTYQPSNIPGLKLWLDANESSTFSTTSGKLTWTDKSGTNHNAVSNSTTTIVRNTSGAYPYVYFNAGNIANASLTISSLILNTFPLTYFCVFNNVGVTDSNFLIHSYFVNNTGIGSLQIYTNTANAIMINVAGGSSHQLTTNSFSANAFHILTVQMNTAGSPNYIVRIDGLSSLTINNSTFPTTGIVNSNGSQGIQSRGGTMYIAETLLYQSSLLTQAQYQQVEGYLAWKWGLQTNLPTTHPYYSSKP